VEFFSQPSRTWQQQGGSGFVSAKAGENTPSESATTVATSTLEMHGNALMLEIYPTRDGAQAGARGKIVRERDLLFLPIENQVDRTYKGNISYM
jgi:hypothetical protein